MDIRSSLSSQKEDNQPRFQGFSLNWICQGPNSEKEKYKPNYWGIIFAGEELEDGGTLFDYDI